MQYCFYFIINFIDGSCVLTRNEKRDTVRDRQRSAVCIYLGKLFWLTISPLEFSPAAVVKVGFSRMQFLAERLVHIVLVLPSKFPGSEIENPAPHLKDNLTHVKVEFMKHIEKNRCPFSIGEHLYPLIGIPV